MTLVRHIGRMAWRLTKELLWTLGMPLWIPLAVLGLALMALVETLQELWEETS